MRRIRAGIDVGGIVTHVAEELHPQLKRLVHAEVMSPLGVAVAVIHEETRKTINTPIPDDISELPECVSKAICGEIKKTIVGEEVTAMVRL